MFGRYLLPLAQDVSGALCDQSRSWCPQPAGTKAHQVERLFGASPSFCVTLISALVASPGSYCDSDECMPAIGRDCCGTRFEVPFTLPVWCSQEKQLRVNMGVAKLREKVKQQQQKVEKTVRERLEKNQEYFKKNVKEMTDNVSSSCQLFSCGHVEESNRQMSVRPGSVTTFVMWGPADDASCRNVWPWGWECLFFQPDAPGPFL